MGRMLHVLLWFVVISAVAVPGARADERADWGVVVAVGTEDWTLVLENDRGFRLLAVDPLGEVRGPKLSPITLSDIRPGDHVDYAWSPWAGMAVADVVHVTPRRLLSATPR